MAKISKPSISASRGAALADDSLQLFTTATRNIPMLSAEEEYELGMRVFEHKDKDAAKRLVESHLRLVVKMAMKHRGKQNIEISDLIQEANLGLMRAVEKFDPTKGFRLSTYAQHWIKSCLGEFVFTNSSSLRMTNTSKNKQIFRDLLKFGNLYNLNGNNADEVYRKVAETTGATYDEVFTVATSMQTMSSLDSPLKGEDEDGTDGYNHNFAADTPTAEEILIDEDEDNRELSMLRQALKVLNERELAIFTARRLKDKPETLEEVAERYKISRERVRQLEVKAFEKIQAELLKMRTITRWKEQDASFIRKQAIESRAKNVRNGRTDTPKAVPQEATRQPSKWQLRPTGPNGEMSLVLTA